MDSQIDQRIKNVMSAVFDVPVESLDENAALHNIEPWDSLGHMTLIVALEDEFGIKLDETVIETMINYPIIVATISSYIRVGGKHLKYKFLIITESAGNPRSFPVSEITQVEETYPYMIREKFRDSVFWQLSFGNISTEKLLGQAIAYLFHWNPDFIIVHSGLNDCRPEAFTEFQKAIINKFSGPFFGKIRKYLFHPELIKRRQVYRTSKTSFKKTLKTFKLIFSKSTIFWLGICAGLDYEKSRPGLNQRMKEYNDIIKDIYNNDLLEIQDKMIAEVKGFNADNLHWNKNGHKLVADILIERINSFLTKVEKHKNCGENLHENTIKQKQKGV